jgi:phage tail P2-like protein
MIQLPGSALLREVSTTGLERAEADADCERLLDINAELIIEQWDPWAVETKNIPVLAFGLATTLWEDTYWVEDTKRQWLADQWTWKSKIGTQRAIEMALTPSGYNIVQALLPPQGLFISPDMTKEEWDKWVHLMPELRVTYAVREGLLVTCFTLTTVFLTTRAPLRLIWGLLTMGGTPLYATRMVTSLTPLRLI